MRLTTMHTNTVKKIDEEAALEFCPTGKDDKQLCDCLNHGQFCHKGDAVLASLMDSSCNSKGKFEKAHWFPQIFMLREYGGTKVDNR